MDEATKDTIRSRVDLRDYACSQGLRPLPGHRDRFLCPWRPGADSDGFQIRQDGWHDFVANEGGDCFEFVMRLKNCDFPTALSELARYAGVPTEHAPPAAGRREPVAVYDYRDQGGQLVFQVCRYLLPDGKKTFRQRRPDPDHPSHWIWNTAGIEKPPYRLPDLVDPEEVAVAEGEKDVDRLWTVGIPATCNPGGAGKWESRYNTFLEGKRVIVFGDNDEPGRRHAEQVAESLLPTAASVKVVFPSGLPKGDVSDWFDYESGTPEKLRALIDEAPEWRAPDEWPALDHRPSLPTPARFPLEVLPDILARMAVEISETIRVSVEVAALCLLTITGLCIGRNCHTRAKRGVEARANLYSFIFMAKGERKSSAFTPAVAPLESWVSGNKAAYQKEMRGLRRTEKRLRRLEDVASDPKAKGSERQRAEAEIEQLEAELDSTKATLRNPAILAEDATSESLVELMRDTGGTAGVFTDDGRTFLKIVLGLYSNGESREDLFLKAYDGTSPIRRHRARSEVVEIVRPCAGILLMVQTDYLRKVGEEADLFESGFISRNLFCYPESWVGKRDEEGRLLRAFSDREIDPAVADEYATLIHRLLDESWESTEKTWLELAPEARALWAEYHDGVEAASGEGGELQATIDFAIRYPTQALRLSLNIAKCHGHDYVTQDDMSRAISLAIYFSKHAERCHQLMRNCQLPPDAQRVLKRIREKGYREFSVQQMQRELGLKSSEQTQAAVNVLAERHYCRPKPSEPRPSVPGRKPSPVYDVHPKINEE